MLKTPVLIRPNYCRCLLLLQLSVRKAALAAASHLLTEFPAEAAVAELWARAALPLVRTQVSGPGGVGGGAMGTTCLPHELPCVCVCVWGGGGLGGGE